MQVINAEHLVMFDVDETLVSHTDEEDYNFLVVNPYSNSSVKLKEIFKHTELLKQYKGRGMFVVVWSKAGCLWADIVIKHLMLEDYVDLILTKPDRYVDDLEADRILGERVYLK